MTYDIILVSKQDLEYLKNTNAALVVAGAIDECEDLIIVDCASTEKGALEFLEDLKKLYGAKLVKLPENRGTGYAINHGLGLSRAPFLFFPTEANDKENSVSGWFLLKEDMKKVGMFEENLIHSSLVFDNYIQRIRLECLCV